MAGTAVAPVAAATVMAVEVGRAAAEEVAMATAVEVG